MRATYDKPRGWLLTGHHSERRRISIFAPEITSRGEKIAKKYILATDATDISHASRMQARARAHVQRPRVFEESVANVADSSRVKEVEAHRLAAELLKLHRDGAISGPDDPEAPFYACLVHAFGATYNRKDGP